MRLKAETLGLEHRGQPLPVLPGMAGSAEIRTGQRSMLRFLARPMLKSGEAFLQRQEVVIAAKSRAA